MRAPIGGEWPSRLFPAALLCAALISGAAFVVRDAAANEVSGYVELTAGELDMETKDAEGNTLESSSEFVSQRFNVVYDRRLFPNLRLRLGSFLERAGSEFSSTSQDTDTTTTRLRPFFNLSLRTPVQLVEVGYNRSEDRFDPDGSASTTDVRETYSANLAFLPSDLPNVRFDYFRTNLYDETRLINDRTDDRFQLDVDHAPIESLALNYRGTLTDTSNRVDNNDVRAWTHTGRATYDETFLDRRMRFNADYRLDYQSTDIRAIGGGQVVFPVFPIAGLSAVDDSPEMDALTSNGALIDGFTEIGGGVNIGLPDVGGDDRPRNLGLDLATATELNRLIVWVDRDLPPEVAGAFSWDIWVSDDNLEWDLHEQTGPAAFGSFQTRFEVDFATVEVRYVKVVVSPLEATDPFAADFTEIFVTEVAGALVVQAEDVTEFEKSETSHLLSFNLRTRLHDGPDLYHELSYFMTSSQSGGTRFNVSNGLSLGHRFNRVYALTSRVAQERDRSSTGDRETLLYSASFAVQAIDALQHRLVFSGRNDDGDVDPRDSLSAFLFTTARLYRGIDLNVSLGTTTTTIPGETLSGDQITATAAISPHRTMTFNLSYRDQSDDIDRRDGPDERDRFSRTSSASVAYNPLPTLYLFGSYRVDERSDEPRRRLTTYSGDWSPFPDGTLQLGFRYTETFRSEGNAEDTTIGPRLRWNFSRGAFLEAAYRRIESESDTQLLGFVREENEVLNGTLRITF